MSKLQSVQQRKALLKRLRNALPSTAQQQTRLDQTPVKAASKPLLTAREQLPPNVKIHATPVRTKSPPLTARDAPDNLSARGSQQPSLAVRTPSRKHPIDSPFGYTVLRTTPRRPRRDALPEAMNKSSRSSESLHLLRDFLERDAILIALDTESERHGLLRHVVEIGITILRTRDIKGLEPGLYGKNWFSLLEHHHIVIDSTKKPTWRMASGRFGKSKFLSASEASVLLARTLQSLASTTNGGGKTEIALLGQSLEVDLTAFQRCPALRIDLIELINSGLRGLHVNAIFDTLHLGRDALRQGVNLPSLQLGPMVRQLGIDPRHYSKDTLKGTHNAINDSAYTMFGALLIAMNVNLRATAQESPGIESLKNSSKKGRRDDLFASKPPTPAQRSWMQVLMGSLDRFLKP